ncbi:hypothetical protein YC2023_081544 [Brassica napus]
MVDLRRSNWRRWRFCLSQRLIAAIDEALVLREVVTAARTSSAKNVWIRSNFQELIRALHLKLYSMELCEFSWMSSAYPTCLISLCFLLFREIKTLFLIVL